MPQPLFVGMAALSLIALGSAGSRVARAITPSVWDRLLIVPPLIAATMTVQALGLGLFGWGTHPVALAASSAVTWAIAHVARPAPGPGLLAIGLEKWRSMDARGRAVFGALVGAGLVWCLWSLRRPVLGPDALNYHIPEAIQWFHDGRPGSVHVFLPEVPVGSYPLTNEVLMSWLIGLSRSLLPLTIWTFAAFSLFCAAMWRAFRLLGAPAWVAGLGVSATALVTPAVVQLNGPNNDVVTVAWLACCAALCLSALRDQPGLIAPAIVAGSLAVGTKTSALPLALVAIGFALASNRRRLRSALAPIAAATAVAVVVGGVWYIRNLIDHGSPLWPFVAAPWGTAEPPAFVRLGRSLLGTPPQLLRPFLRPLIVDTIPGGVLLLAGVSIVLIARIRRALVLGALAVVALLLWMNAPFTGVPDDPAYASVVLGGTRYALPVFAVAAAAIAAAAAKPSIARWLAAAVFSLATLASLVRIQQIGSPLVPELPLLLVGILAGAGICTVIGIRRISAPVMLRRIPQPVYAVVLAGILAVLFAPVADGYALRSAAALADTNVAPLVQWVNTRPDWESNDDQLWMTNQLIGTLSGDEAQHLVSLVPPGEDCEATLEREGWVIFSAIPGRPALPPRCEDLFEPAFASDSYVVFAPDRSRASSKPS